MYPALPLRDSTLSSQPDADDHSSDYGSDFTSEEEELINALLGKFPADDISGVSATAAIPAPTSTLGAVALVDIEDQQHVLAAVREAREGQPALSGEAVEEELGYRRLAEAETSPEGRAQDRLREDERAQEQVRVEREADKDGLDNGIRASMDGRSPLERFRKPPRKSLSVSDLIAPAWCELQYWYTLTKFGRKKATPAMVRGSAVHKTLEEQVHTSVPVDVMTKEDGWALRICNVILGLHTLRTTGMTRELEVWGAVDGQVVTGIIDMVSRDCPNPELDADAEEYYAAAKTSGPAQQQSGMSLSDYFLRGAGSGRSLGDFGAGNSSDVKKPSTFIPPAEKRIYLTDIKTRGGTSRSVPSVSSTGFRPTLLQLHLYYHFLSRLITSDDVTMDIIASRFGLKTDQPFSDAFIAQISSLNEGGFSGSTQENVPEQAIAQNDTLSILLKHNSLSALWRLMKQHLRLTFLPDDATAQGSSTPTYLSPLLTATYISASSEPISYVGSRSFFFDPTTLYPYLTDGMQWWHGRRPTKGVPLYEAWKCRICEFRDNCEWRMAKERQFAGRKAAQSENGNGEANVDAKDDPSDDKVVKE